jgi:hypothetical protein
LAIRLWRDPSAANGTFGVPVLRDLLPVAAAELRRARRYEHPLAVIVLMPVSAAVVAGGSSRPTSRSRDGRRDGRATTLDGERPDIAPVTIRLEPNPVPSEQLTPHQLHLLVGSYLRGTLRETDLLISSPATSEHIVVLPECPPADARLAVQRMRAGVQQHTGVRLSAGIGQFPRDGYTVEDLLARAREACRSRSLAPEPAPVRVLRRPNV